MKAEQNDAFLRDEYLLIQNQYEDYDRRSLTIKSWISAASIAAIALGAHVDKTQSAKIWALIAGISLCIWYLEGRWKMFQYAYRGRLKKLEAHFRNAATTKKKRLAPFQIYDQWFESYRSVPFLAQIFMAMWQDFVFIPYLPVIVACAFLYFTN